MLKIPVFMRIIRFLLFFGLKKGIKVYLDESLERFDHVYPACGSPNSAIKLTIPELEKYAHQESWIDVTDII